MAGAADAWTRGPVLVFFRNGQWPGQATFKIFLKVLMIFNWFRGRAPILSLVQGLSGGIGQRMRQKRPVATGMAMRN